MTPQQLKNAILQQAIQGKLVEQRAEEGTGEELYKAIQDEMQKLIQEGKLKKQKSLPEITEEEIPFEIPDTWKWVRAGDILYITMGQSPKAESINNSKLGYEFHQGKSNFSEMFLNKSEVYTTADNKVIEAPAIVMSVRAPVGDVNLLNHKIYIGRGLASFQIYTECDLLYIYYYFLTIKRSLERVSTGSTFKAINSDIVNKILVPLPPFDEQKRIVEKIEELLPLVERYEKAWTRLEELNKKFPLDMQKAILGQAIQGKLVEQRAEEGTGQELFEAIQEEKQKLIEEGKLKKQKALPEITEEEIPFEIPETWKWVRLGDLAKVTGGYAFKSNEFTEQGVRVIRISDFNENGFVNSKIVRHTYDDTLQMFLIEKKNILLCMTGGTVGKSLFVKDVEEPMMTNQRVATIKPLFNLSPEYINYNILSFIVQKTIVDSKNSTNDNISMDTIKSFLIPLPPLAEQKRIVDKIEELLPLVEKLK